MKIAKVDLISSLGKKGDDFDVAKIWTPNIDVVGTFKVKNIPEGDKGTVS
jgi:hypothetical protein